eukprot:15357262-Ditylum_brightwellii.AAC.1
MVNGGVVCWCSQRADYKPNHSTNDNRENAAVLQTATQAAVQQQQQTPPAPPGVDSNAAGDGHMCTPGGHVIFASSAVQQPVEDIVQTANQSGHAPTTLTVSSAFRWHMNGGSDDNALLSPNSATCQKTYLTL